MTPQPPPQLSPELVLILPPEVAAIARMTLPGPPFASPPVARSAARRGRSPRRVALLVGLYVLAAALTVTPLALAMKAVPSHRTHVLRVNHELRADRNDAH
jgi:hypothetical protein